MSAIHFFPKGTAKTPSSRVRAFRVAEALGKRGWKVVIHSPPAHYSSLWRVSLKRFWDFVRHLIFFATVPRADVIFLQKTIFQPEFVRLAVFFKKLRALKIIFDIDDLARNKETKLLLKHASLTITSSHFLVNLAKTLSPRVEFIPTSVAFELYKANEKKSYETKTPVVGWIGTLGAHRENLTLLPPVFKDLVGQGLRFKFLLVADSLEPEVRKLFSEIPGLDFEMTLPKGNPGKDSALIPKIVSGF